MIKKLFFPLVALALAVFAVSCSNDDKDEPQPVVSTDALPDQAKSFISLFFSDQPVKQLQVYGPADKPTGYELDFVNGTEIDFNGEGSWTKIDAGPGLKVNDNLVPVNIRTFAQQNLGGATVVEIDRSTGTYYSVEFSEGTDAIFDLHGQFIRYD